MTAETIQLIQTGINLLCASGVISTLLYYNSRKRKEAALASQEENKTISSYADEWKALYERSNDSVVNLNSKVDELYEEINQYRIKIRNLRDEKNDLKLALHEAQSISSLMLCSRFQTIFGIKPCIYFANVLIMMALGFGITTWTKL